MNKWIALLLTLMLLTAAVLPALAEQPSHTLEGFVTELVENGFVMEDQELGETLLNTDDATVWDGVLANGELAVGQYVFAEYDGKLTRSIPPQAHADKVGCYVLKGTAGGFLQDGVLLVGDEVFGDVIVKLDASRWHVFEGVPMTVYYNGIMALSLPGQVSASAILLPQLSGVVTEKDDNGFSITTNDGASYYVELDESSLVSVALPSEPDAELVAAEDDAIGDAADGASDSESEEASIANGDWTIPMDGLTDEGDATDEPAPTLGLSDIGIDERVKVYFSGEYLSDEEDAVLALEVLIERQ